LLIDFSPFTPITRADNPDLAFADDESNGHDAVKHHAQTVVTNLGSGVLCIKTDDASGIDKSQHGFFKRDAMLLDIGKVFIFIPKNLH